MIVVGLVAFAVTVVVALLVALQHTGVLANDDQALIDLRVFDVGAHTPLVAPMSATAAISRDRCSSISSRFRTGSPVPAGAAWRWARSS